MGTPASMPSHMSGPSNDHQHHFDMGNLQRMYEGNPQLAQYFRQQGKHFSAPMGSYGRQIANYPSANPGYDMAGQMSQEDYWTQMGKTNMGTRTGLTPGTGVNLDDLFGGDGWGGIWEQQGMPRP